MRHLFPLTLLSALALPAHAQMVTLTPAQIGEIFCIGSLGNDMAPVEALLSPDLSALVAEARQHSEALAAARPDEKPPLGDGLPWRTWQDYADGCTVAPGSDDEEAIIQYSFAATPDASYSNTLRLVRVTQAPGGELVWRIDDIALGDRQSMRGALITALEQP
jgi:hypothetical protein